MLPDSATRGEHINNSNSTLQKLLALYVDSDLSDVTLVVGANVYHVHKLILSMSSDVLKTMLTDLKWLEAYKDRVILSEEPECCAVFSDFIRYMYTGGIHLTGLSVLPVLTLADKYNLRDLSETCVGFMCENCDAAADAIHVVSWLQYARLCSHKTLERHCLHYIECNFQKVFSSSDFLSMRLDTLIGFLRSSSLVVLDEYSLFVGVKRWLLHQWTSSIISRSEFERLVHQVLVHIRFSNFKQAQLELLMNDPFIMEFSWVTADKTCCDAAAMSPVSVLEADHQQNRSATSCREMNQPNSSTSCEANPLSSRSTLETKIKPDTSVTSCSPQKIHPSNLPDNICGESAPMSLLESNKNPNISIMSCHNYQAHPGKIPVVMTKSVYLPRNYLCEDWSTQLVVSNFSSFEKHAFRTLFFSTPASSGHGIIPDGYHDGCGVADGDETSWDWQVDLYPKGILFPHGVLIGLHENYLIDEQQHRTVRIGVIAKCFHGNRHVEISVLAVARGREDDEGSEFVRRVVTKKCIFDSDGCLYNVDNIVPFADLEDAGSSYLTGPDRDTFKIIIIIKPTVKTE